MRDKPEDKTRNADFVEEMYNRWHAQARLLQDFCSCLFIQAVVSALAKCPKFSAEVELTDEYPFAPVNLKTPIAKKSFDMCSKGCMCS